MRGDDLDLQNRMIKFSQFLQDNEKKKGEADAKRTLENTVTVTMIAYNEMYVEN